MADKVHPEVKNVPGGIQDDSNFHGGSVSLILSKSSPLFDKWRKSAIECGLQGLGLPNLMKSIQF
jgi:hypothetical protein